MISRQAEIDLREVIDLLAAGDFIVEFIRINPGVPDSLAIVVRTIEGISCTPVISSSTTPIGDQVICKLLVRDKRALALLADSTNASKPGQRCPKNTLEKHGAHH